MGSTLKTATKPSSENKSSPDISGVFFGLHQLEENNPGDYEWEIVQIIVKGGKITEIKKSKPSVKQVTTARLATIVNSGGTIDNIA